MSSDKREQSSSDEEMRRSNDGRKAWERPALRRLAANQAESGLNPCNDGGGTGCGPGNNHS
jgi:hypothetical protein